MKAPTTIEAITTIQDYLSGRYYSEFIDVKGIKQHRKGLTFEEWLTINSQTIYPEHFFVDY
jgi:hypothetical protein